MSQSSHWQYGQYPPRHNLQLRVGAPREYTPDSEVEIVESIPGFENSNQRQQQLEQESSISYFSRDTASSTISTRQTTDTLQMVRSNGFVYTPEEPGSYHLNGAGVPPMMHPNQFNDARRTFDLSGMPIYKRDYDMEDDFNDLDYPPTLDFDHNCIGLEYRLGQTDVFSMEQEADGQLAQKNAQIEELTRKVSDLKADVFSLEQEAEGRLAQKNAQIEELARKVSDLKTVVENQGRVAQERDAQIEAQARELSAARAYLATTDERSGSDVINLVQRLNEEILQLSSSLADLIEDSKFTKEGGRSTMPRATRNWTKHMPNERLRLLVRLTIGEDLLSFLTTKGPGVQRNSILFQYAIQALLVGWAAHHYIGVFYDGGGGDLLGRVLSRIKETKTQGVAAKWRTITSQTLMTLDGPTAMMDVRVTNLYSAITGLLTMAGWRKGSSNDQATVGLIKRSLHKIHDVATEIKATIEQYMPSCDIDPVFFHKSVKFDPTLMDNCTNGGAEEMTLCTVALGLKKRSVKQVGYVEHIILKPEVVLMSALAD